MKDHPVKHRQGAGGKLPNKTKKQRRIRVYDLVYKTRPYDYKQFQDSKQTKGFSQSLKTVGYEAMVSIYVRNQPEHSLGKSI